MSNKKMMVIGGLGYIGRKTVELASKLNNIQIYAVQRSKVPENLKLPKITYIKGDAMKPEEFKDAIEECDSYIHTIGTFIDTSVTKCKKVGKPGTYEQMNFETAKRMGDMVNKTAKNKKKFIYISANQHPPFLTRYLETKRKAENYLQTLENLDFYSIRPGLITDVKEKWALEPLAKLTDVLSVVQRTTPFQILENTKFIGDLLKIGKVDHSVSRMAVSKALLSLALSNEEMPRFSNYDDIIDLSNLYDKFD